VSRLQRDDPRLARDHFELDLRLAGKEPRERDVDAPGEQLIDLVEQ
jgi:hypothetical protein